MALRDTRRPVWRTWILAVVTLAAVGGLTVFGPSPAAADTDSALAKIDTSLHWVPADAAVYSSMLRNREQIEAILDSRAFAKIKDMPIIQFGLKKFETEAAKPGNPAAMAKMFMTNPQVQDLLAMLGDMFSDEVFVYADTDMTKSLDLVMKISSAMRWGPMVVQLRGGGYGDEEEIQAMLTMAVLGENIDSLKVPGMVVGFKLKDTGRATLNLGKLEMIAGIGLVQVPELANALKRTKVAGHEYLVLTLAGDMVPWDKAPLDALRSIEPEPGLVDKLVEKIKKEKLVLAIGLRDNYLLCAIGSSTDVLARLGQKDSLATRPEFQPLAKYADERLVAVEYVSEKFLDVVQSTDRDIDEALAVLGEVLPATPLSEDDQAQILKDVTGLATEVKKALPPPGAMMSVGYLVDGGMESYLYNWSKRTDLDGSKPLSLLSHVGGSPLLALVGRQRKGTVEDYDRLISWLGVGYGYFEKFAMPQMSDREREEAKQAIELFRPVLKRLNNANRDLLIPALDGQIGLVIDGRMKSRQFLTNLPPTKEPMPMVEPALLLGLNDSDLMRKAVIEYWETFNDAVAVVGKINPEAKLPIPEPEETKDKAGVIYALVPPPECPVDKQIAPNVGIANGVCVFSMSKAHSHRLMVSSPLAADGVLTDAQRPRAGAGVLEFANLLKTATPWIDMATKAIVRENMPKEQAKAQLPAILDQVHTVLDVLSCMKTVTSETYLEDGVIVTHTRLEIRDLPE
ncbi:MAG: hypothetical protein JW818_12485 [Pirellulales bacterium]|nr:hypothetical protein [Pirellulales bacterium]